MAISPLPAHGASWDAWAADIDAAARAGGGSSLPTQTGNSGKFLTTNGTAASWATVSGGTGTGLPSTILTKTTTYTAAAGDFVQADGTTAGFTVTLPTAPATGALVVVKKTDASTNVITVAPAASGTIDGDANATIIAKGAGAVFEHVGGNAWQITAVTSAAGPAGPTGPTGPAGSNGTNGTNGTAATISVGTVTTGAAGTSASVTNAGTSSAAVFNFTIPQGAAGTGGGTGALTPTTTKTSAYTVAVGELAMMNVAGGATTLTLPAAPADKAQVGYRAIGATSGTPLTINRGGSDTIGTAGATSASIPLADETVILQYDAPNARWLGVANVRTQASVDARYDASGAATTAQAFAIQRANHTGTQPVSSLSTTGTASSSTYLRGDGAWATPAGGGGSSAAPQVRDPLPTGSVTGVFAHSFPRYVAGVTGATWTTGTPRLVSMNFTAGEVISKLSYLNGGTAMATPTHQWACVTDLSGTVLAISADDTSGAWAGSAVKTFTLSSPYTVPTTGTYYVGLLITATTMPTPQALGVTGTVWGGLTPLIAGTTGALAGPPPSVGSSIGNTIIASSSIIYTAVS